MTRRPRTVQSVWQGSTVVHTLHIWQIERCFVAPYVSMVDSKWLWITSSVENSILKLSWNSIRIRIYSCPVSVSALIFNREWLSALRVIFLLNKCTVSALSVIAVCYCLTGRVIMMCFKPFWQLWYMASTNSEGKLPGGLKTMVLKVDCRAGTDVDV